MRTFYLETYGCQMNEADSELVTGRLLEAGYRKVESPGEADIILANTCAVREHAEQRVVGRLNELGRHKLQRPGVILGVLGCMSQHLKEGLLKQVGRLDLVAGPDSYRRLPALIEEATNAPRLDCDLDRAETYAGLEPVRTEGVRAWVTILRGCDKFCSFCIVPHVRGRERCLPADAILAEVREVVRQGFKEVVLLGQTVNSYQHDGVSFAELLRKVNAVEGIERIRFTSPYPTDMTDDAIAAMAECEHVCPHLHLPLQSAADAVLERMRRGYTIAEYDALVHRLRVTIPDLALGTDLIVGFPDETEAEYQATLDYVKSGRFDSAFMFKYSPRPGTLSARWDDTVPEEVKSRRLQEVIDTQEGISKEINQALIGREVEVLVEGRARRGDTDASGKTPHFKTVVFPDGGSKPGDLVTVEVERATGHSLYGRLLPGRLRHRRHSHGGATEFAGRGPHEGPVLRRAIRAKLDAMVSAPQRSLSLIPLEVADR